MQRAGEGSSTLTNARAVIVFSARAFGSITLASVDPDHGDALAASLNYFRQRAKTASQVGSHLDEPAAIRKVIHRLFLTRTPGKPAFDVAPVTPSRALNYTVQKTHFVPY